MNVFDKFLNSISYKFSKGYPDMNNEQDILIIESELRQLGVEAKIPQSTKNTNPDINNILQTLQKAGARADVLPQVEEILTNYSPEQLKIFTDNFRKYTVNDLDRIYDVFASDFFNIKAKEGEGRGEVMLLIGLKDSKAGGLKTKDITIDGKIYEVKELTGNEFRTGSDGSIAGTSYLKNLINFKTLLNKDIIDSLDLTEEEKKIIDRTIDYYTKYEPNNGSAGFLKDLKETCAVLKNKISTQKETPIRYISAGGKKIAVNDDDYNKLVPQAGSINIDLGDELQDTKIKINKLKRHPWIEDPNLVMEELRQKLDSFIKSVDYFILFNYPGSPKGKLLSSKETTEQFMVGRIVFASINAKLIKQ